MSDPNRRQELIEILSDMRCGVNCFGDTAERIIYETLTKAIDLAQGLPSEQPETHDKRTGTHACDYISRQAAIDLFPNDALEWDTKDGYVAPHLARRMIEQLPSAQQWIPCSERFPEEYGEYRITWTTSDAPSKRFIGDSEYEVTSVWDEERKDFKGEWLLDDYIKAYQDVKVIAWKPLEEPYKGGKA